MHRGRFIGVAVLTLVAARAWAGPTGTTPTTTSASYVLTDADFTLQDPAHPPVDWQTNGNAGLSLNPTGAVPVSLALTNNVGNEASAAWTLLKAQVPSFTMYADVNVNFMNGTTPKGNGGSTCPADGFAMVFADATPDALGGGGGSIGLYGAPAGTLTSAIAFEVNLWFQNSIASTKACDTNQYTTFEFTDINATTKYARNMGGTPDKGGAYINQTTIPAALNIVNGGWYRYQWNVDNVNGVMSAYITGLEAGNASVQNMPLVSVTLGSKAPTANFNGRWGLTAGTGGAVSGINVARVRVVSPMVAVAAPTTGGTTTGTTTGATPATGTTAGTTTAGTTTAGTTAGTTTASTTAGTTTASTTAGTTTASTTAGTTTASTTAGTTAGTTTASTTAGTTAGTTTASTTAGTTTASTTAGTTTGTTAA